MAPAVMEREPVLARDDERPAIECIEGLYSERPAEELKILMTSGSEAIELPDSLVRLIRQVVHILAQGESVSIVPVHKELTTQQAADILNVSRQYFVRLLEEGAIPFHRTGTHRRIRFGDLMEYKRQRDRERRKGLAQLTQKSQELGLYQ